MTSMKSACLECKELSSTRSFLLISGDKILTITMVQYLATFRFRLPTHINKLQYYQQVIQLTGLGTLEFQNVIDNIRTVQMKFNRHFGDKTEVTWNPSIHTDGYTTIEASTRLFTPRCALACTSMTQKEYIDFQNGVDPDGVLTRAMQTSDLLHMPENEIMYYKNCSVDGTKQSETRYNMNSNTNNKYIGTQAHKSEPVCL